MAGGGAGGWRGEAGGGRFPGADSTAAGDVREGPDGASGYCEHGANACQQMVNRFASGPDYIV
jgi:hypothetical protein